MSKSEQEILRLAAARFKEAHDADLSERTEADGDIRFAINDAGCQWDENVRNMRKGDDPPRPCLVINMIPEKIDQIEGEFRQAEISYKIRPVDSGGDTKKADIIAGMLRFIEYDSSAKNAYNTSMNSTLYGGRGAWRWNVVEDEDNPFVRSLKISRLTNVFTIYVDPYCKEMDKSDARYWFVTEKIPQAEYEKKYGKGYDEFPDGEEWIEWKGDESRRIAEYWWKDEESITFYKVNRGGKEQVVTEKDEWEVVLDEKKVKRPKIKWAIITAGKILEGPKEDWPSRLFPFVYQTGKEVMVKGKGRSRGMVRFAKEPAQLYNYAATQMTEILQTAPKAHYLLTANMVGPYQKIWDSANRKNYFYLPFKADPAMPGGMPKREVPATLDASMFNMLAVLEHNVDGAMGVHPAKLGEKSNEKSGKAIFARQAQGSTGAYVYSDNFVAALTHSCRIGIDLIPSVYDTERIVRIVGEDGIERELPVNTSMTSPMAQQVQGVPEGLMAANPETLAINDLSGGRYDVRVTVGPSYSTQRQEALEMLVELVGRVPQIAPAILDLIGENMDLPKSAELVRRLKKLVPPDIRGLEPGEHPPPPPQPDPKLMLEMQKLQIDLRDQIRKEFDSHFKALLAVSQAESLEAGNQMAQYEAIVSQFTKQVELQQKQQEIQQLQQKQTT
jgi:hypothetical protein